MDLKHKIVTVIGLGKSGMSAARLLLAHGAQVKVSERSTQCREDYLRWAKENAVGMELGKHTRTFIQTCDLVIVSPGIRLDEECVIWAREAEIPVWGEVELAFRFYKGPIIAVTGSNGKTTVVTLIKDILTRGGKDVGLCGNIGYPLSDIVMENRSFDFVVLEISSFQLETIDEFKPHIAVFLNFSQNHLDRHRDIDAYFSAKKRILMNQGDQDHAVLNKQDPKVSHLAEECKARVRFFNTGSAQELKISRNPDYLAAFCVGDIVGIEAQLAKDVLDKFPGVEHRLEKVRVVNDVQYINDSKATTAEAGRWALESISQPVIMICGGKDKNIDFSPLKDLVKKKVKKMILIGEAREKLKATFSDDVTLQESPDLQQAVLSAQQSACPGDVILLSPMCASFDMFESFEHRGRFFKEIVSTL